MESEAPAQRDWPPTEKNDAVSDAELLIRVGEHDRDAFVALYTRVYGRLHRFLAKLVRHDDQVEELVNDVMMTVWQKAPDFQGHSRVATWILGIAYKMALKRLRGNASRREDPWALPPDVADNAPPDKAVSDTELRIAVNRALAGLSVEHRAVVTLTFFHGYSYGEIATIVQCPPNTVKTRMFHAREQLRRLLPRAEHWDRLEG
ncbi:MAG: sigma-70 family RNA polymerase sigma factor [Gammaproteobacteria bacterium]|nr:sigma-70 family RNA polymerase sigma factor [Gammaproteobacteria bacterium]MDJ0870964.1 sigma-70 family RNA polymerase sigma factor [Gammaproteobacteria bacterium]MDJ0891367.1 sigma-70 family RNA polymerase sigma factor [Gammaproteobacteria bacterium]